MAPKEAGDWRPCGDYRVLNAATGPDNNPLTIFRTVLPVSMQGKYFSLTDLARAYHQIHMEKKDAVNTVIMAPFGLFKFFRIPFGIKNAAQIFQGLIDVAVHGLPYVFAYIDGILVVSSSQEAHREHRLLQPTSRTRYIC